MNRTHLRRRYALSVAIVTLASLMSRSALAVGFPDTNGTDYKRAFAYLQEEGVVQGYSNGFGMPNAPLTRIDALKVILIASGKYDDRIAFYTKRMPPIALFSDVDQRQWYGPYLETAFEQGVITGYQDGTFRPAQLLRVEEAIAMLMRTFAIQGESATASLSPYIENQPQQWYTPSINAAVDKNLIMHKGKLRLGTAMTRGQFFDMVYRLHSISNENIASYAGPEPQTQQVSVSQPYPTPQVQVQNTLPPNVSIPSQINHPHASEKYFSISMPSLGIEDLTITHPEDAVSKDGVLSVLSQGVGHLFAYPGGGGKIMVYGHSSAFAWDYSEFSKIFRRINELNPGDRVYVTYAGSLHIYEVTHEQTIAASKAGSAFKDDGSGEELILFTCWPPDSISQRYLVHAVPVETVALR